MSYLCQPEFFHQWWDVHAEAATEAFFQAVPAAYRVGFRTSPGLNSSLFGWFLLVGATQFHPVAMVPKHGVQIVQATDVIMQYGFANSAYQYFLAVPGG